MSTLPPLLVLMVIVTVCSALGMRTTNVFVSSTGRTGVCLGMVTVCGSSSG